jgi:hypothetical protein
MRPTALSIAVLLGIAGLAAAEARAAPVVAASITIESERTVLVGGKRHHSRHGFHRGRGFHRDKGFARHHHGFHRKAIHRDRGFARRHHGFDRFSRGSHHSNAFVAKRIGKGQFVIIRPAYGRTFRHHRLLSRPLIKNGSFARRPYW